jgi:hypothetical protein
MENFKIRLIIKEDFLLERIVKRGDKWVILSKRGKKLFTTTSKKKAKKRLGEIEYFKNKNK